MNGDKNKSMNKMARWIEAFCDGMKGRTRKGKRRIPSLVLDKRIDRRWRRRRDQRLDRTEE